MASLHDGKALKDSNEGLANTSKPQSPASKKGKRKAEETQPAPCENKKRKAGDAPPIEEDKENTSPPSTPVKQETQSEAKEHEKTPGRVGPVKPRTRCPSPDIKPFKGPPRKKVRKTRAEKDEEYRQFARENEDHWFHEYVSLR